jgi:AcrR family transcriptional regulator
MRRKSALPKLLAGEEVPAEPQQRRSLEKRAALKKAGLALFAANGYAGTSVEEISRRAGLAVGSFYQHFRSKRQLLLWLMDELLGRLAELDLRPTATANVKETLRAFLSRAFLTDVQYLGAYRAWQEATLSDAGLARKEQKLRAWTTTRLDTAFVLLQQLPGARRSLNVASLARLMDGVFWNLLGHAAQLEEGELQQWVDAAAHLLYHALFTDPVPSPRRARASRPLSAQDVA